MGALYCSILGYTDLTHGDKIIEILFIIPLIGTLPLAILLSILRRKSIVSVSFLNRDEFIKNVKYYFESLGWERQVVGPNRFEFQHCYKLLRVGPKVHLFLEEKSAVLFGLHFLVKKAGIALDVDASSEIRGEDLESIPLFVVPRIQPTSSFRQGYVNTTGQYMINPRFHKAAPFFEGLARVGVLKKDQKSIIFGFINKKGQYVIDPQFEMASRFKEDLCAVRNNGKHGFVNKEGEYVIDCQFDECGDFNEGYAAVKLGDKCGVIDKQGNVIIPFKFDSVTQFCEGFVGVEDGDLCGFVDKDGVFLTPMEYTDLCIFNEGLAAVQKNNLCGFVDQSGKEIIACQYDQIASFSEGVAVVKKGNRCGFINKRGEIVIDLLYDKAHSFREGLAPVCTGGKWGLINKNGNLLFEPCYAEILPFSEGLARFRKNVRILRSRLPKYGFLDRDGNEVIAAEFDMVDPFKNGLAKVLLKRYGQVLVKAGYINKEGQFVWTEKYHGISASWFGIDGVSFKQK